VLQAARLAGQRRDRSRHGGPRQRSPRDGRAEARKIEGTKFIVNAMFKPSAVRDGGLVTGKQQNAGPSVAALVVVAEAPRS